MLPRVHHFQVENLGHRRGGRGGRRVSFLPQVCPQDAFTRSFHFRGSSLHWVAGRPCATPVAACSPLFLFHTTPISISSSSRRYLPGCDRPQLGCSCHPFIAFTSSRATSTLTANGSWTQTPSSYPLPPTSFQVRPASCTRSNRSKQHGTESVQRASSLATPRGSSSDGSSEGPRWRRLPKGLPVVHLQCGPRYSLCRLLRHGPLPARYGRLP